MEKQVQRDVDDEELQRLVKIYRLKKGTKEGKEAYRKIGELRSKKHKSLYEKLAKL